MAPLDVILREKTALPTGTLAETRDPTCLSCYSVLVKNKSECISTNYMENDQKLGIFSLCPNCNLPMCKPEKRLEEENYEHAPCYKNQIHHDYECQLFQRRKINLVISPDSKCHPFYNV